MNLIDFIKKRLLEYNDVNEYIKATYLFMICLGILIVNLFFLAFYYITSFFFFFRAMLVTTIIVFFVLILILKKKLLIASIMAFISIIIYLLMGYFHLDGMNSYSIPILLATLTFSYFYFGYKWGILISSIVLTIIGIDLHYGFSEGISRLQNINIENLKWIRFITYIISLGAISSFFVFSVKRLTQLYKEKQNESDKNANLVIQLRANIEEKSVLLKEIHHRVKNNLQIISSLLRLQANHSKNSEFCKSVKESQTRILSMSLVHEALYQNENLALINMKKYLTELINYLYKNYHIDTKRIKPAYKINPIQLNLESVVPYGLIVNELITNIFKYAFPYDKNGNIMISFYKENNSYVLNIEDDGIGIQNTDIDKMETLGLSLVNDLVIQLGGNIKLINDKGLKVRITTCYDNKIFCKKIN